MDVLLVLAHVLLVRNFVADGLLREMVARGLKVAVVAPDDTLPVIRKLSPGLISLHPLSRYRPRALRLDTLRRLRLGSFLARRDTPPYALKLAFSRKVKFDARVAIAFWRAVSAFLDAERVAVKWAGRLRPRRSAVALVRSVRPRLVLWPTTISDTADFEIVQAAARANVPLVMCEGSWDNLVTKGAIWPRPDRLLVWGEFSRRHALSEHQFASSDVTVTGPPHFGVYRDVGALTPRGEWFSRHGLDPSRRLILVAGSTIGHRVEPRLLRQMAELVERGTIPPAYIWYRPHPKIGARFDRTAFDGHPHIRIDPGIDEGDPEPGMTRIVHDRETRQRADGLAASDVIVSMFSTVVLEGALLGKPVLLVDLRQEEGVSKRPTSSFQTATHVRHILTCPWIRMAPNAEALGPMLQEYLALDPCAVRGPLREFAQDVASCGPESPHDRLIGTLQDLLRQDAITSSRATA